MRSLALLSVLVLTSSCAVAQDRPTDAVDTSAIRRAAFDAEAKGDHASAADAFLRLTELEATNPEWFLHAGENLGRASRFNDAMDLLDGASEKFPAALDLLVALAQVYHMKADAMVAEGIQDINVTFYYQDASRTAKRVLEVDPDHLKANLLHASAQFQLGETDAALAIAEHLVAAHPDDYGSFALLGKIALQNYVGEKQRFDRDDPRGTGRGARITELAEAADRAERALARAAELDAERAYPRIKLGDLDAWRGDLDAALVHYRDGLAVEPTTGAIDHSWLRGAVAASDRVAMYEGARSSYAARPDADPKKTAVIGWYVAQSQYDAGDWKEARRGFEEALRHRPDFVRTYYYLVQCCFWSGDEKSAARFALTFAKDSPRTFADMIRSDAQATSLVRGIAQTSYEANRLVESRELNHVLALAANTVDEWNNYAFLCRETGKYDESFAAYERALELEESPQLLNDAAVILQYHLRSEENLATARDYYERAIELAQDLLEAGGLQDSELDRVRTALRDARSNLGKL
ncbi:MAG: tetratricopeptide repeat protein [Planctomycetes bacterium]|nr:tetratricopeptide repeat protein [Planctomycetota bacterium]